MPGQLHFSGPATACFPVPGRPEFGCQIDKCLLLVADDALMSRIKWVRTHFLFCLGYRDKDLIIERVRKIARPLY